MSHVRHVTSRRGSYDYTFNMRVMISCATCHWVIMLTWAYAYRPWWWHRKKKAKKGKGVESESSNETHPGRHVLASCCATWHAVSLAEVLDFPPLWGLLDAHGLWHCATPACVWLWYRFVKADLSLKRKTD